MGRQQLCLTRKVAICVTHGKCQRSLWHQLDLASCEFHSYRPSLIGGNLCKNVLNFHNFFLFLVTILSYTLILPVSQLQTQQLMSSLIMSHIQGGPKKTGTLCFERLTSSNFDRFSNLFHGQKQENISTVIKDSTTPQVCCYTTL